MTKIEAYARWLIKRRAFVLVASLAFIGALTAGAQHITFTNDYRYFFSEQNPHLKAFLKLQETYASPDTIILALQPKGTVEEEGGRPRRATDADVLKVIKQLTEDMWQTPHSTRVDSIANFQHTRATEEDLIVEDLVPEIDEIDQAVAHKVHEIATNDAVLVGRAISHDGRTAAVIARLTLPNDNPTPNAEAVQFARELQAEYREKYPDIQFELTGSALLSASFSEGATNDLKSLTPAMYVLIALMVWLLIRSGTATGAAMLVIAFATTAAMGTAGWIGMPISPPSANAPTVILTVAVADSIHIIVTMLVEMRKGRSKDDAIVESMRVNFVPVLLTSVTTAIGFFSLNFSDAPPVRDLGSISAFGAIIAWGLSIGFLPALLSLLSIKANAAVERQSNLMGRFAGFVIKRKNPILMASVVVVIAFGSFTPTLRFNDMFAKYFDSRMDFRVATDFVAENLTSIYQIHYSVETGEDSGINDPKYMHTVEDFANYMREDPLVMQVSVITDVMKRVNKSMNADDESFYRVPDDRREMAQYLLLYEMSLPYGLDLTDQIDVAKSATKISLTINQPTTAQTDALIAKGDAWIKEHGNGYHFTNPAGQAVMFGYIGEANVKSMTKGTAVALVLISGILLLALRSVRLGLVSLVPNLVPPIVAFGILAAFFTNEVGFWAAPIVATALGLIVDATVHFLSKYRNARNDGKNPEDAVTHAFERTGTALWVSTLVLIVGFALLAYSPFKFNNMMGAMVALNIAIALILDFLLLPVILLYVDRRKSDKIAAENS